MIKHNTKQIYKQLFNGAHTCTVMMYCIRPIDSHFSRQFEIWDAHVVFSTVQQDVCLRERKKKSFRFLVCLFTELNLCFTFSLLNSDYIRQQYVVLFFIKKQTYFKSCMSCCPNWIIKVHMNAHMQHFTNNAKHFCCMQTCSWWKVLL